MLLHFRNMKSLILMGPFILFWMNVSLSKSNYLLVETDKFKSPTQRQNDDVIHTNLRMKGILD